MYTLYYSPGACSVATQVVLHELGQQVKIIDRQHVDDFSAVTPLQAVPVLVDGKQTLTEGAAIILHLLSKHENTMLPEGEEAKQHAVQQIMFANATMHPAYNRLFFLTEHMSDGKSKQQALNAAASTINTLWEFVENELQSKAFLGGIFPSAADIMLTVYSTWGQYFPVQIHIGEQTTAMLNAVQAMPSFQKTLEAQRIESAK